MAMAELKPYQQGRVVAGGPDGNPDDETVLHTEYPQYAIDGVTKQQN